MPELSDTAALEAGLSVTSLAAALAENDGGLMRISASLRPTSDVAVALNTALMGDGAVIRVARRRDHQAAAASRLRRVGKAGGEFHPFADDGRQGRARDAGREP